MRDRVAWSLRFSTVGLVLAGYAALASVLRYPTILMAIPVLILFMSPVGERWDRRVSWYRTITTALNIACCCFIPLMLVTLGTLNAVLALVMYIQCYLMLHEKRPRDYYYIFLMAFFLVLGACYQQPEPIIAVVLFFTIVFAVWAFVSLRTHEDLLATGELVPADILPLDTPFGAPQPDARNPFDFAFVGWVTATVVLSLAATGLVFVGTPRVEAGVFGSTVSRESVTGLSQQVDLRGGNYVREDPTPVMRVVFPNLPDGKYPYGPLYWRATTMSQFNGARWTRKPLMDSHEPGAEPFYPRDLRELMHTANPLKASRTQRPGTTSVHQEIYLTDTSVQHLPALDLVTFVNLNIADGAGKVFWDSFYDFTLTYRYSRGNQFAYDAWSEIEEHTPEKLRAVPADYGEVRSQEFERLTAHHLRKDTRDLVRQVAGNADNVYDKAVAIRNYLSGPDFTYTMAIPAMSREYVIDDFIMRVRAGHCEFFASAMALMLRSEGIPTRVVSGYRGGEWDEGDGAYLIRKSMAHLWVEVLFPGVGWVRFDPAPRPDYAAPTGMQAMINQAQRTMLTLQVFWYQEVVGFDRGLAFDRLRDVSLRLFGKDGEETTEESVRNALPATGGLGRTTWLIPTLFLLLVLGAGLRLFVRRTHKGVILTVDQQRAAKFYSQFVRRLENLGIPRGGRTAEEMLEEIQRYPVIDPVIGEELVDIYNEVRFGGRRLSAEQYAELTRRIKILDAI